MTENMKKFLEVVSKNEELAAKVDALTKDELIAMAKELGIALTEADFAQNNEVSDDELGAVAGGGICACVLGGGGEFKDYQNKKHMRCACVMTGSGDEVG